MFSCKNVVPLGHFGILSPMKLHTFIFIGRSGCGKGTQAELLAEYIKKHDKENQVFRLETGDAFRHFIEKKTYTSKMAHEIYTAGHLMPEFLSVAMWGSVLIDKYKDGEHLIIDGSPRRLIEAKVLDSALKFYERPKPYVIYVDVGKGWAVERLKERHRLDDTRHDIVERMKWFDADVVPTIGFFRGNPDYHFLDINGERSVEAIHADIISQVFSSKHSA